MSGQAMPATAGSVIEHTWIAMPDGCRLSARIWLPAGSDSTPVPAVLEYIPYRKRDGTRMRDDVIHGTLAMHGYAAVRVDLRGSGDSGGLLHDEYLLQEQDDALAVIAWIAAQPWCSGAVGMMGKSWGGFNALQVAARRPSALKAIVTVYSTDDRYADDIHYAGGALLNDNLWWGSIMLAYSSRPPDPLVAGEDWRKQWLERLDALPFFPAEWLTHQRRDAFWQHGSICEDFSAIECPVLAVGGWADGYSNAVFRLLSGLTVPCRGLVGPWAHVYPHDGTPGPAIDFMSELVIWWDQWLKGRQDGPHRPKLQVWQQDFITPVRDVVVAPGRWIALDSWPRERAAYRAFPLDDGRGSAAGVLIRSPQTVGRAGGEWCGFGVPGEAAGDQREDEAGSFVRCSEPLDAPLEIFGQPIAELSVAAEASCGLICVRLGDVLPDGEIMRVSYGVLNLTRREGNHATTPLIPGELIRLRIPLNAAAHRFAMGHRIHVAISTSYWPMLWPSASSAGLRLFPASSSLKLPLRGEAVADPVALAPPDPSTGPKPSSVTILREGAFSRSRETDPATGVQTIVVRGEGGLFGEGVLRLDEIGTTLDHGMTREFSIHPDDPLSARHRIVQNYTLTWPDRTIAIETEACMHADQDSFFLTGAVMVSEMDETVFSRTWQRTIPRDGI